jgi:hypothetical protein
VRPLITETLPVTEAARRALMSLHGRIAASFPVIGVHGNDVATEPMVDDRTFPGPPITGGRLAEAFRLRFPQPVAGLIVLGHPAHFGSGLFRPVIEREGASVAVSTVTSP